MFSCGCVQEAVMCVLDVSVHMGSSDRSPTRLQSAVMALEMLVQQKVPRRAVIVL
jgi:hypothetical protein